MQTVQFVQISHPQELQGIHARHEPCFAGRVGGGNGSFGSATRVRPGWELPRIINPARHPCDRPKLGTSPRQTAMTEGVIARAPASAPPLRSSATCIEYHAQGRSAAEERGLWNEGVLVSIHLQNLLRS